MKRRRSELVSVDNTVDECPSGTGDKSSNHGHGHKPLGDQIGNQIEQQNVQGSIHNTFNYYTDRPTEEKSNNASGRSHQETSRHRELCLQSLDFPQSNARASSIRTALHETCKWFMTKPQYKDWRNDQRLATHKGFLWLKGNPGTGKSTMMKFLSANEKTHTPRKITITFFFNARGTTLEKSTLGLYRSLLYQLIKKLPHLTNLLDSIDCIPSDASQTEWSVEILQTLIRESLPQLGEKSLILLVDALDECSDDEVLDMVRFFEELGELATESRVRFRVALSSRHYPHITVKHGLSMILEHQEEHESDIKKFIDVELRIDNSQKADLVKSKIMNKASGIFLWVSLVIPLLNRAYSRGRIHELERVLDRIPEKLESLFQEILSKDLTQEQDFQSKEELETCIRWVLYAQRPLTITELYFAITYKIQNDQPAYWDGYGVDENDMFRFVLDCSRGFVEKSKGEEDTVQFIHETVREFFLQRTFSKDSHTRDVMQLAQLHASMSDHCHDYIRKAYIECPILSDVTNPPKAKSSDAAALRAELQATFPLLEYAVKYCLIHSDIAQGFGLQQSAFLAEFRLRHWIAFWNLFELHDIRRYPATISIFYVLAHECLPNLLKQWLAAVDTIDIYGGRWGHPLVATIMSPRVSNKLECLNCFLAPAETSTKRGSETCFMAGGSDYTKAVDTLMNKMIWNNYLGYEPVFSFVMRHRYMALAKCLLATGRMNMQAVFADESVLIVSAEMDEPDVVEFLIQNGAAFPEARLDWLLTVFSLKGRIKLVQKILTKLEFQKDQSILLAKALAVASGRGHTDVVDTLIAAGANINLASSAIPSPLSTALLSGQTDLVRKLLRISGHTNIRPALLAAMMNWNEIIVRNLLEREDIWMFDNLNCFTFFKTTKMMNDLVGVLLNAGVGAVSAQHQPVPSENVSKWHLWMFLESPLLVAVRSDYAGATKQLLKARVRFPAIAESDNKVLLTATSSGSSDIVEFLIEEIGSEGMTRRGQQPSLFDTALTMAYEFNNWRIIKALVAAGADSYALYVDFDRSLNSMYHEINRYHSNLSPWLPHYNEDGSSPISFVAPSEHIANRTFVSLEQLLGAGVTPNREVKTDISSDMSPLSMSRTRNGTPTMVTVLLLTYGAVPEPWLDSYFTPAELEAIKHRAKEQTQADTGSGAEHSDQG